MNGEKMMNPFKNRTAELEQVRRYNKKRRNIKGPIDDKNLFTCKHCGFITSIEQFNKSLNACENCGAYYPISAKRRLISIVDEKSFVKLFDEVVTTNPLDFPEYENKLQEVSEKTNLNESILTGVATINSIKVAIGVMDTRFFMASMGSATGERITRLVEYATTHKLPLILICASGGARMQEGIISLMQMAKTSAAIKKHSDAKLLYISILTHPTTGGVTASFASLGDIILAEPEALIGFAGPRVIENTIKQKLPEGFQRSEYLVEHGFLDAIVAREDMREAITSLLQLHNVKTNENMK